MFSVLLVLELVVLHLVANSLFAVVLTSLDFKTYYSYPSKEFARQVSSVVSWTFRCVSLSFSLIGLLFSFSLTRPPPSIGPASLWTSS